MQAIFPGSLSAPASATYRSHIRQCRLTAVAVPSACSELAVSIQLQPAEEGYRIAATVADTERTYMEYKGEMSV